MQLQDKVIQLCLFFALFPPRLFHPFLKKAAPKTFGETVISHYLLWVLGEQRSSYYKRRYIAFYSNKFGSLNISQLVPSSMVLPTPEKHSERRQFFDKEVFFSASILKFRG